MRRLKHCVCLVLYLFLEQWEAIVDIFLGGIAYSMLCQENITSLLLRNKNNYVSYVISYSPNCFHIQLPVRMRATICCDYVQSRT